MSTRPAEARSRLQSRQRAKLRYGATVVCSAASRSVFGSSLARYPQIGMGRRQVNIATVGTGFIAETRARAYAGVSGYQPCIVAAVSRTRERLEAYARRHGVADVYTEPEPVLDRRDIEVVDLCVPNHLHRPMAVLAAGAVLGGMESALQILMSNAHIKCNLSHTRLVEAFAPDGSTFANEYLIKKLETSADWSPPAPDDDRAQGNRHMIQDFVECVAEGHAPQVGRRSGPRRDPPGLRRLPIRRRSPARRACPRLTDGSLRSFRSLGYMISSQAST